MGLLKSSVFMPVARHSARAPLMLRPWVEVWERYTGMSSSFLCYAVKCAETEHNCAENHAMTEVKYCQSSIS